MFCNHVNHGIEIMIETIFLCALVSLTVYLKSACVSFLEKRLSCLEDVERISHHTPELLCKTPFNSCPRTWCHMSVSKDLLCNVTDRFINLHLNQRER